MKVMTALRRKNALLLGAGALGAAILLVGALVGQTWLAGAGLTLTLVSVLGLQALSRREPTRSGSTVVAPATAPAHRSVEDQIRLQHLLAADIERGHHRTVTAVREELLAHQEAVAANAAATSALHDTYPDLVHHLFGQTCVQPAQLASALEVAKGHDAARVLTVDVGVAALFFAQTIDQDEGGLWALEGPGAAGALSSALQGHDLAAVLHELPLASVIPAAPHAYLPWHDLTPLSAEAPFDLVVIAVADDAAAQAAMPVLPVLEPLLSTTGVLVTITRSGVRDIAHAWSAHSRWQVSSAIPGVSVVRRCT